MRSSLLSLSSFKLNVGTLKIEHVYIKYFYPTDINHLYFVTIIVNNNKYIITFTILLFIVQIW